MQIRTASTTHKIVSVRIKTFAEDLVICSLNVRGLSNTIKTYEIFRWLRLKKKKTMQFTFFKKSIVLKGKRTGNLNSFQKKWNPLKDALYDYL